MVTVKVNNLKNVSVVYVEFDDEPCGGAVAEPYTVTIPSLLLSSGSHTIKAKAVNNTGKQVETSIKVKIVNSGGGNENESPNFVTFTNGILPPSWKTSTWVIENTLSYDDDNYCLKSAALDVSNVLTNKTVKGTVYGEQITATTTKLKIGDIHHGGIVVYFDETGEHGFVVAPSDSELIKWNNGINITTGATGIIIGTGKNNTAKIVQEQGQGNYAAKICNDLTLNGYDDWYLPSIDELWKLMNNRELLNLHGKSFWSSSEYGMKKAWVGYCTHYPNPKSDVEDKSEHNFVRCIRDF